MIILAARLKMTCRGVRLEIKPMLESRKQEITTRAKAELGWRRRDAELLVLWNKRQGDIPGASSALYVPLHEETDNILGIEIMSGDNEQLFSGLQ